MRESIDIGRSFNKGWELFKENMSYLVFSTIIIGPLFIFMSIIPVVNIVTAPPLLGGLFYAVRRAATGQELTYGALRDGCRLTSSPLILSNILFTLVLFVPYVFIGAVYAIAIPYLDDSWMILRPESMQNSLFRVAVDVTFLGFVIAYIYIYARFQFVIFYIVEDGMGAVDSLKASWAATGGSWGKAVLFILAVTLINLIGMLALLVGLVFTMPLTLCMMNAAYEQLEGKEHSAA